MSSQPTDDNWQPIETAPRDEVVILCDQRGNRWIRADLYEQNQTALSETANLLLQWQKRAEQVEAKRDRLRAALDRIVEPRAWATPGYLRHIAQEALDHD